MEPRCTDVRAAAALRLGSVITAALLVAGLALGGRPAGERCLYVGLGCAIVTPLVRLGVAAWSEGRAGRRASVLGAGLTALALVAAVVVALAPRLITR